MTHQLVYRASFINGVSEDMGYVTLNTIIKHSRQTREEHVRHEDVRIYKQHHIKYGKAERTGKLLS